MLKRNYKKLVSLLSAAAMLTSLAAPAVMAENSDDADVVIASETAGLAEVLLSDDFNDAEESVLLQLEKTAQDPYTAFDTVDIYIGRGLLSADATTNASIKSGVGVDASKALTLSYGSSSTSNIPPRIQVKAPAIEDNFMVTMDVYPTGNQDLYMSDDSATAPATGAVSFGLVKDEWNKVEIYVSRFDGKLVNVNGETVTDVTTEDGSAPVLWGNRVNNSGDLYIDNIVVSSLVNLPTPIPTATPAPTEEPEATEAPKLIPEIGEVYDFESDAVKTYVALSVEETAPNREIPAFEFHVAARSNGGAAETKVAVASGKGVGNSNALQLNCDNFANTNRGARIKLLEPEANEYKVSFDAWTAANQDIRVSESTSENSGFALDMPDETWNKVEILMIAGQRMMFVNNQFVEVRNTKTLPVLWGKDENYTGSFYIDNYTLSTCSAEEVAATVAATVSVTESPEVTVNGDAYDFIGTFSVPTAACGLGVAWSVAESTDDGATWTETTDISASSGKISADAPSTEKTYKVTATVKNGKASSSKDYIFNYVLPMNVIETAIDNLEIANEDNKNSIEKLYKEIQVTPTPDPEATVAPTLEPDATPTPTPEPITIQVPYYWVGNDFTVPTTDGALDITWSSSDTDAAKIVNGKTVEVYPLTDGDVILTATISYGADKLTKDFTLDFANYYQRAKRAMQSALETTTVSPIGEDGSKVDSLTFNESGVTTVSYDLDFSSKAPSNGVGITWSSKDKDIISDEGVINVDNMDANAVTVVKKATYYKNGKVMYAIEKEYELNVQFDTSVTKPAAQEKAIAYAKASDDTLTDATAEKSAYYDAAMEMLYDRYVTRFDANCDANFEDIPSRTTKDFEVPTEGIFGSTIYWKTSSNYIEITDGKADVTRASSDKKCQLTATFSSGISTNRDARTIDVIVTGTGGSGSSGGGGSSSYGGGNTYIGSLGAAATTPAPTVSNPVQETPVIKGEFADLDQASWAAVAITYLANKGIVSGRTSTTFDPNANITRAEFAKIIVGAFELPLGGASAGFADVAADAWYAPYVDTCFTAGIITGYDSTTFGPNDLVTRQDMAVMVMRAANLKGIAVEAINEKIDFADADEIAPYAVDAVTTLQQGGIINGMTADTFAPTANATRAQAAKILYSLCFE